MKTTKKALSVLLAVIMIMSSMSVCFGTFSFTASAEGEPTNDQAAVADFATATNCDAMKNLNISAAVHTTTGEKGTGCNADNSIQNTYTYTITAKTYADYLALVNVIDKFNYGLQYLGKWKTGKGHNNNGDCDGARTNCTDFKLLKADYITAVKKNMTDAEYTERKIDSLLNALFNDTGYVAHTNNQDNSNGKVDVDARIFNTIVMY